MLVMNYLIVFFLSFAFGYFIMSFLLNDNEKVGVIFVQDPQTSKVPTKARGFLYIGKYADTVISEAGG